MQDDHAEDVSQLPLTQSAEKYGMKISYPEGWDVEWSQEEQEIGVSINSKDTSFVFIQVFSAAIDLEEILETTVSSFQSEYPEIDIYDREVDLESKSVTQELQLFYHELISTVVLRIAQRNRYSLFSLFQGWDQEIERLRPTLLAIVDNIRIKEDLIG